MPVAALALIAATLLGPVVGISLRPGILLAIVAALVALERWPARAAEVVSLAGLAVVVQWAPMRYAAYHLIILMGVYWLRDRPRALLLFLAATVIVIPKELFRRFYHQPFLHDWVNPYLLPSLLFATAYWWRERRRASGSTPWLVLSLFPTQPINPLALAPTQLWGARRFDPRAVLSTTLLLATKAAALWSVGRWGTPLLLSRQTDATLLTTTWLHGWSIVLLSYLQTALSLSATADFAVLLGRTLGWPLPHSFRYALLAWNPVELWRRWAIYNRRLLLTLVYFPLGGNERHRYLNVMCTFLASAVVLHSGWFGSRYWEVGAAGWRDQTVYFLLQGLAVCGCLWFWSLTGKDPAADRTLRLSPGRIAGTIATQALSAWLHVLVLGSHLGWELRWRFMVRLLGWPG